MKKMRMCCLGEKTFADGFVRNAVAIGRFV